jgi:hypothetical protein
MQKSETIKELAGALSLAQSEMLGATKASVNPFFKSHYADLAAVWDACRKALTKNGLAVVQTTSEGQGGIPVETILIHSSGEWISGVLLVRPVKDDPQAMGSAITYARRYALAAMVGVAPEDDDGNAASSQTAPPARASYKDFPVNKSTGELPSLSATLATAAQIKLLTNLVAERNVSLKTGSEIDVAVREGVLTKKQANIYINELSALPKRGEQVDDDEYPLDNLREEQ